MISIVLKVLVVLLLIRLVLRALVLWLRAPAPSAPGPAVRKTGAVQDLVRDQVCGTFVIREQAVRAVIGGREELFCSAACRDKAALARAVPAP